MRTLLFTSAVVLALLGGYVGSYLMASDYVAARVSPTRHFHVRGWWLPYAYLPLILAEGQLRGHPIDVYMYE